MITETDFFDSLYAIGVNASTSCKSNFDPFVKYGETAEIMLVSSFETAYILDLRLKKATFLDTFWIAPSCGLLDKAGNWAFIGGLGSFSIWNKNGIHRFEHPDVFDVRLSVKGTLLLLDYPWGKDPHVWEFDLDAMTLHKRRTFPDYALQSPTSNVIW